MCLINTKHCLESHMTISSKLCSAMLGYQGIQACTEEICHVTFQTVFPRGYGSYILSLSKSCILLMRDHKLQSGKYGHLGTDFSALFRLRQNLEIPLVGFSHE